MAENKGQERIISFVTIAPLLSEILAESGSVEITTTGNSMCPMLHDRKSRVRLAKPEQLQKGDLPLYRRDNGAYVLHRIVSVNGDILTCCGDAQWHLERGIRTDQVLAVVTDFTWKDRWVSCDSLLYRLYWRIWVFIRPLRHLVFGGSNRTRRIFSK